MIANIKPIEATELIKIISFMPQDIITKIPNEEIEYLNKIKNHDYITKINSIEDIKPENIYDGTKNYLAYIFLKYLATKEEKEEYEIILRENKHRYQKELSEKYDVYKVFEKRKAESNEKIEEKSLTIVKEKNILEIIIDKIKKLLRIKKE